MDSSANGKIASAFTCVYIQAGTLTLESGQIATSGTAYCIYINTGSIMNMNSGIVSTSGSLAITNNGTFNKTGGTVLAGSSTEDTVSGTGTANDTTTSNGSIELSVNTTYPDVEYSINLPVIDSFELQRSEDNKSIEKDFTIVVDKVINLFDERELTLTLSSDLELTDAEDNKIPFTFTVDNQTVDTTTKTLDIIISETTQDTVLNGILIIDTKDIPLRSSYITELVYSISVSDTE
ncbi:MAG: hypothetical protein A2Y17_00105 [Clostridiales bacterium GWF2_38_85]|nr:MAG: hypothetical protein A2Y17_00105 [Clostridiales bacterium GWF2_38_85]HBL83970.1 hypothetical protein [Clostridiales bacterium]